MTNTQTGGRVEAIHKADTSLMLVLGMAWSNTASDHVRVIDETANVNTTLARIAKEIATFLPRGSTREQADALAWVAQRQEEAAEGLRAIGRSVAGQEPPEPPRGPIKMATGGTLTPDSERVVLTLDMLQELARARFGSDPKRWRFVCPACKSETAVGDFVEYASAGAAPGQECIGRYDKAHGCDHAAYGLIPLAPWIVITPEGRNVLSFALADVTPEASPDLDSNAGQEVPHEGESAADVAGS